MREAPRQPVWMEVLFLSVVPTATHSGSVLLAAHLRHVPHAVGFPGGSARNESACNVEELGLVPRLGRSLEKGMATHSSTPARKSNGQRNLAGYSPWGCKESDTTEQLSLSYTI